MVAVVATFVLVSPAAAQSGFDCLIEPTQVVDVRMPVDGVISSVAVQRGDPVRKGQVLVELQSNLERAGLEAARYRIRMEGAITSARNRVDYSTRKLARLNDLHQQSFASAQARDEADAEKRLAESELQTALEAREMARIELRRVEESVALRTVASPFDGVVVDRLLNPGDLAESGAGRKAVLKVAQIDPLKVDVVMPAALFGSVKPGTRAGVTPLGTSSANRLTAVVVKVDKVVDAASGTFVARLELPNPRHAVPGGIRCSAQIEGVAAPVSAPVPGPGPGPGSSPPARAVRPVPIP